MLAVVITFLVIKVRPALADDDTAHNYSVYCARCHGISGRGDGDYAAKLHKRPRDFADCAMMARIPDTTIVKAIEGGGAAVGLSDEMPSWQGALDDGEITALAGYIRSFCTTARPDLAPLPAH
ncbi:MAG: cytochrome c [Candidatus Binataceae bacterium]